MLELQWAAVKSETHNWAKCKMRRVVMVGLSALSETVISPPSGPRKHHIRGGRKNLRASNGEMWNKKRLLTMTAIASMDSL